MGQNLENNIAPFDFGNNQPSNDQNFFNLIEIDGNRNSAVDLEPVKNLVLPFLNLKCFHLKKQDDFFNQISEHFGGMNIARDNVGFNQNFFGSPENSYPHFSWDSAQQLPQSNKPNYPPKEKKENRRKRKQCEQETAPEKQKCEFHKFFMTILSVKMLKI